MTEQTHPRKWWPKSLVDETMPEGRAAPSDWLEVHDGKLIFGRLQEDDGSFNYAGEEVAFGDTVEMEWLEHLGTFPVEFRSATDFFFTAAEAPKCYSECFVSGARENNADTLADLAGYIADSDGWYDLPVTIDVEFVRWGSQSFIVAAGDHGPTLVPKEIVIEIDGPALDSEVLRRITPPSIDASIKDLVERLQRRKELFVGGTALINPDGHEAASALEAQATEVGLLKAQIYFVRPMLERWNLERTDNGDVLVCQNQHEKGEACEYERWVPLSRAEDAERERDALKAEPVAALKVVPLEWSGPDPSNDDPRHDWAITKGAWDYTIEWNSGWPPNGFSVCRDEDFVSVSIEPSMAAAKAAAQADHEKRIRSALVIEPAQPDAGRAALSDKEG